MSDFVLSLKSSLSGIFMPEIGERNTVTNKNICANFILCVPFFRKSTEHLFFWTITDSGSNSLFCKILNRRWNTDELAFKFYLQNKGIQCAHMFFKINSNCYTDEETKLSWEPKSFQLSFQGAHIYIFLFLLFNFFTNF